jgi:large subunit ribosomal protein L25
LQSFFTRGLLFKARCDGEHSFQVAQTNCFKKEMKSIEIKGNLRKNIGKKHTAALRANGEVPCVIYGGDEIVHFSSSENELHHIIYTPDVYHVKLTIDNKPYQAILHDAQFHPVSDKVLHLDFIEVSDIKPAIVSLPVQITGNSVGIRAGGKLRQRRRYLKVRGLIKDLPDVLKIEIDDLNIGDFIKVEDLEYPNLELLDPARAMILGVSTSRLSKGMEMGEDEAEAAEAASEEAAAETAEGAAQAGEEKEESSES